MIFVPYDIGWTLNWGVFEDIIYILIDMQIPVINPTNAVLGILFPPKKIQTDVFTQIYDTIVKQDDRYTSFNRLAQGGAHILRTDGSYVLIEPDKIQINDLVQDISFTVAKERIAFICKTVLSHISPQVHLVTGIKLVAQIDTGFSDGGSSIINKVLGQSLSREKVEYHLGAKLNGIGLRFSIKKEEPWQSVYELRVEPLFRELSKLFVELDVQFPGPTKPDQVDIEKQIEHVAGFLKKEVKDFLGSEF